MRLRKRVLRGFALASLALMLAGCTPFWQHTTSTPSAMRPVATSCPSWNGGAAPISAASLSQAQANAQSVLTTPRPQRDLYSLTQHLVKHLAQPISPQTRSTPRNEQVGNVTQFYVVNPSQTGYHQITAMLVYETPHLYVYAQQGATVDMQALKTSADLFENSIYATDRSYYGSQWPAGPDDDPHITVLNALDLGPIGGYFSSEDEYPKQVDPYSNERQMIYINLDGGMVPGTNFYNATLAHEFQHMIHWYERPSDPSWTNEGMSVLAQHLNSYTAGGVDQAFLSRPDTMLGGWTDDANENVYHYGAGYLFMDYFGEHYGGFTVLKRLLADSRQTPLNFDDVLAASGYADRFDDVFAKFVIANLLNDTSFDGGAYGYKTIATEKAHVQHSVSSYPFSDGSASAPASVHQYAAEYYDFTPLAGDGAKSLTVSFSGNPSSCVVDNSPAPGAKAEWWSNSANNMDSTLTRSIDLSSLAGQHATLNFMAWYNLEPDFDYGYVEASSDGGQNWTTLPASTSSNTNPNASNYGHGMTGLSGGKTAQWVPESVDLSAYAGKKILLRFETITDDAVHYPGMTIDDITIPQINFSDTVSSDNGWQARGWIRSNNVLPETYLVQAIVYTAGQSAPRVERIPVDARSGTAHITIPDFGGQVARVELAVSAVAPGTILPARYTLTASTQ